MLYWSRDFDILKARFQTVDLTNNGDPNNIKEGMRDNE